MKTGTELYFAAKMVVLAALGKMTTDEAIEAADDQKEVVAKANESAVNETDAAQKIAKQLVVKDEVDKLIVLLNVVSILKNETAVGEGMSSGNKALARSWGFLAHDDVKDGSIGRCAVTKKKSWFSWLA